MACNSAGRGRILQHFIIVNGNREAVKKIFGDRQKGGCSAPGGRVSNPLQFGIFFALLRLNPPAQRFHIGVQKRRGVAIEEVADVKQRLLISFAQDYTGA